MKFSAAILAAVTEPRPLTKLLTAIWVFGGNDSGQALAWQPTSE